MDMRGGRRHQRHGEEESSEEACSEEAGSAGEREGANSRDEEWAEARGSQDAAGILGGARQVQSDRRAVVEGAFVDDAVVGAGSWRITT